MITWGADRMDHMDSKSMQPGETPGHLAILFFVFPMEKLPGYENRN